MKIQLELSPQQARDVFNQIFTSALDGTSPKVVVHSQPAKKRYYTKRGKVVSVPFHSLTPLVRRYVEKNVVVGKTFDRHSIQGYINQCLKRKIAPWTVSDALKHEIKKAKNISRVGRGLYQREK